MDLPVEELEAEQLYQDNLVLDEIAYYESPPDDGPVPPFVPQRPEPGSYMDRYDGPFYDEEGIELEF